MQGVRSSSLRVPTISLDSAALRVAPILKPLRTLVCKGFFRFRVRGLHKLSIYLSDFDNATLVSTICAQLT
mgnify:FL=1